MNGCDRDTQPGGPKRELATRPAAPREAASRPAPSALDLDDLE